MPALNKASEQARGLPNHLDPLTGWTLPRSDWRLCYHQLSEAPRLARCQHKGPGLELGLGSPHVEDLRGGKQAQAIFISSPPETQAALLGDGSMRKHVHSRGKKRNKPVGWEHK